MVEDAISKFLSNNKEVAEMVQELDILDVMAYSLNKLPPHYTTSIKGLAYTKLGEINVQTKVTVLKTVTEGFEKVLQNRTKE
jgi:hypothetical protein